MFRSALGAAFIASCLAAAAAAAPPSVEAFGSLPAIADVHLSPDGTHFSAIEPVNGRPAVVVFQLHPPPGAEPAVFSMEASNAVDSYWVNDDRVVCYYYRTKFFRGYSQSNLGVMARTLSASISGKTKPFLLMNGTSVFDDNYGSSLLVIGRNDADPQIVYMEAAMRHGPKFETTMFAVDVDTNRVRTLDTGSVDTAGWWLDEHGRQYARLDVTGRNEVPASLDRYFANDDGTWREAAAYDNSKGRIADLVGLSFDGSALVMLRHAPGENTRLDAVPVKAGQATKTLYANPDYDAAALRDEWTGRVVGAEYADDRRQAVYFDPALDRLQKRLEKALPGQTVEISSWDKKRDRYLIAAQDPHNPPGIYLYTPADGHLEYLMSAYPSLQPADLGDMKSYPYKARDGLDIHAYLTLPPGGASRGLPAVIFPHGGPDTRDQIAFDWWAQFMASRGYAVLQPNFRGSAGYGYKFRSAGFGEWGRRMQDDLSDGVKKLVADGIADPKRVCIVGASYGGYAALAGATFTPELYACAVSYAGVADLASILANAEERQFWEGRLGKSYDDTRDLRVVSPAWHADRVKAPILLLHSTNDLTVPVSESKREESELRKAGKQVRFVEFPGDDHYLQHSEVRIGVLREIEAFLAAHIGN